MKLFIVLLTFIALSFCKWVKVFPYLEGGGTLTSDHPGCQIVDCTLEKLGAPWRHVYKNPYACTHTSLYPIGIKFNVSSIRRLRDTRKARLHWTLQNPAYRKHLAEYTLYVNSKLYDYGVKWGCEKPPEKKVLEFNITSDDIFIEFVGVSPTNSWLLVGEGGDKRTTDAYLEFDLSEIAYQKLKQQREREFKERQDRENAEQCEAIEAKEAKQKEEQQKQQQNEEQPTMTKQEL